MISKKQIIVLLAMLPLVLGIFTLSMPLAHASPKSLYLVADHHTAQFDAWNINPDGTASYQATYTFTHSTDPSGIGIDESSNTLFASSEFSGGVEMVDATTMTSLGVSSGPTDLAGVDVDDANDIVYAVERYSNNLYAYDWDPVAGTLTPRAGFNPYSLPGCSGAFGIAFDSTTDTLWVADGAAGVARAYDVNTWTEDASRSFTPSHLPIDIAVDRVSGFVYTVSMYYIKAYVPPASGSDLISKYDLASKTETTIDMGHAGVGIAVDEVTGYVYVTGDWNDESLEVWNTATATKVQDTGDIGGPAGICIPRTEVVFNPLSLAKDDGVAVCVNPGDTITYTISWLNTNPYTVYNVTLWDDLSADVTFVSATGGGGGYPWSYDPVAHRVTWNIGNLLANASDSVTLTVTVNLGAPPGGKIINYATIWPINIVGGATTVVEETDICPGVVIPEVPMGTIMASAAMIIALVAYVAKPKWRRKTM